MSRLGLDRRRNPDVIGTILGLVMALSAGAFGVAAEDTAGTARSLSTCSQYASRTFYRYVDATELSDIETSHLLRVRPTGPKYWTDERYDSAQLAQARLALRNRPEQRVAFSLNGRCPQHEGTVMRAFGQPGGGYEFWSNENVPITVVSVSALDAAGSPG